MTDPDQAPPSATVRRGLVMLLHAQVIPFFARQATIQETCELSAVIQIEVYVKNSGQCY